jgi:hypothetical protein
MFKDMVHTKKKKKLFFFWHFIMLIMIIINNKYYKENLIKLLILSFIFKVVLTIISYIFNLLNWPFSIIYLLIGLVLIWGFYKTKNRKKYIFKLSFVCIFWALLTIDLSLLNSIDSIVLLPLFMNPHYINNSFEDTSLFYEMDTSEPLLGKLH